MSQRAQSPVQVNTLLQNLTAMGLKMEYSMVSSCVGCRTGGRGIMGRTMSSMRHIRSQAPQPTAVSAVMTLGGEHRIMAGQSRACDLRLLLSWRCQGISCLWTGPLQGAQHVWSLTKCMSGVRPASAFTCKCILQTAPREGAQQTPNV